METLKAAHRDYWTKGYAVLPGVFGMEDLNAWRDECNRLWSIPGLEDDLNLRSEFRRDASGIYVFDRLDPVIDISDVLKGAVLDRRLTSLIDIILGEPAVLFKCKLIRKDPGTGGYLHHQDFRYWRWLDISPNALCSVCIPLYPSNETSGGIEFFPGCIDRLLPDRSRGYDEDFDLTHVDVSTGETPSLAPGDVLIFHALAPHRSGPNASSLPRTLLLPSYAATVQRDLYARYYRREIRRRCYEFVGFERYEASLQMLATQRLQNE
jgi:hypothetical protein